MLKQDWEFFELNRKKIIQKRLWFFLAVLLLVICLTALWNYVKPLPAGLSKSSQEYLVNLDDLSFLRDNTYFNNQNVEVVDQKIFPTILSYVDQAEQYILIDMFLFNDGSKTGQVDKALANELADHLIAKKQANPDIKITIISDPINLIYGYASDTVWNKLAAAGIQPIVTNLSPLRDSNLLYSAPWRVLFAWWGRGAHGWLSNPFAKGGPEVTMRDLLAIPNFKANHRKVFLADNYDRLVSVISSANPHGASYKNSNIAWVIKGNFGLAVYEAEQAVAVLSKQGLDSLPQNLLNDVQFGKNDFAKARLVTEGEIRATTLRIINDLKSGDSLDLAMFYLSERQVVEAMKQARQRGVKIRVILDLNKEAFGYKKNGIPNHSVAKELVKSGVELRWYETHGEQFHSKMLSAYQVSSSKLQVLAGSANFTRRNIADYNLEADVYLQFNSNSPLASQVKEYFEEMWYNKNDKIYTSAYQQHANVGLFDGLLYRLQEASGMSSF